MIELSETLTLLIFLIIIIFVYHVISSRLPKGTPIDQFTYHAVTFNGNNIDIMPLIVVVGLIFVAYIMAKKVSI